MPRNPHVQTLAIAGNERQAQMVAQQLTADRQPQLDGLVDVPCRDCNGTGGTVDGPDEFGNLHAHHDCPTCEGDGVTAGPQLLAEEPTIIRVVARSAVWHVESWPKQALMWEAEDEADVPF